MREIDSRYPTDVSFSLMNGIESRTGNRYLGHQLGFLVRAVSLERDLQLELKLSELYCMRYSYIIHLL